MGTALHIAVISNIEVAPYFFPMIKRQFEENMIILPIQLEQYAETGSIFALNQADLIIVWLNLEVVCSCNDNTTMSNNTSDMIGLCKLLYVKLKKVSHAKIIWLSFEDYYMQSHKVVGHTYCHFVDNLNMKLSELLDDQVSFINLKQLIAEVGIDKSYDIKGKYRWNSPYSKVLFDMVAKEIHKQYLIEKGITKKCIVLDCDNVLWGGILSEDGVENIKLSGSGLGRFYQEFQRFIVSLYQHGVIIAVCSKNDISDVLTVFHKHSEMILNEKHIACFQVEWGNKPDGIKKISKKLNISLDSMVFVDDSPIEIEAVKAMLPEVTTVHFKRYMEYEQFSCFNLKNCISLSEVEKRNQTYKSNGFREELKATYENYADYLAALEIQIDIHIATSIEINRISELSQRTNKFTIGKRYTVSEIKKLMTYDLFKLYSVHVSDRFSDLGLVGAFAINGNTLTMFSLSCRALGRDVEKNMLSYIRNHHLINCIEFISTGKNTEVMSLMLNTFPEATLAN